MCRCSGEGRRIAGCGAQLLDGGPHGLVRATDDGGARRWGKTRLQTVGKLSSGPAHRVIANERLHGTVPRRAHQHHPSPLRGALHQGDDVEPPIHGLLDAGEPGPFQGRGGVQHHGSGIPGLRAWLCSWGAHHEDGLRPNRRGDVIGRGVDDRRVGEGLSQLFGSGAGTHQTGSDRRGATGGARPVRLLLPAPLAGELGAVGGATRVHRPAARGTDDGCTAAVTGWTHQVSGASNLNQDRSLGEPSTNGLQGEVGDTYRGRQGVTGQGDIGIARYPNGRAHPTFRPAIRLDEGEPPRFQPAGHRHRATVVGQQERSVFGVGT